MRKSYIEITAMLLVVIALSHAFHTSAQSTKRVLFIGNSYTASYNMPNMVKQIALSMGDTLITGVYAPGGTTLQGHSADPTAISMIHSQNWDYIVLQEQSQRPALPPNIVQQNTYPYAKKLDSIINSNDTCIETMFFMTWGRKYKDTWYCGTHPYFCSYDSMQWRLSVSYLEMGKQNHASVAPAGLAWKASRQADSTINLYSSDHSHPSTEGSFLNACVFYDMIFKKKCAPSIYNPGMPGNVVSFLENIADQVVFDSITNWIGNGHSLYVNASATDSSGYINFDDKGVNGTSYYWDYGDANGSSLQNPPPYQYVNPGTYPVRYTVSNACDTIVYLDTVSIFPVGIENVRDQKLVVNSEEGVVSVEFDKTITGTLTITELTGRYVIKSEINGSATRLPISLPKGVYIITLQTEQQRYSKKFVAY